MELLDTNASDRYLSVSKLGEGAFGEVKLGVDTCIGRKIAMKYINITCKAGIPRAVFREMESLKQLQNNCHIIKLLDVFATDNKICLIFEYAESDLGEVISQAITQIPTPHIKLYATMIFDAISYCHSRNVIHRDIKPSNILLNSQGVCKLADFGLARIYNESSRESLSHQVATRWYRAPELLFASRHYTTAVDIWAAGAVIAELYSLHPLFPGSNDIDQIFRVFQVTGTPSEETWPGVSQLPDYCKVEFPVMSPIDYKVLLPAAQAEDITFVTKLLQLDPAQRPHAKQVLGDSFFKTDPLACCHMHLRVPGRQAPPHRPPVDVMTGRKAAGTDFGLTQSQLALQSLLAGVRVTP